MPSASDGPGVLPLPTLALPPISTSFLKLGPKTRSDSLNRHRPSSSPASGKVGSVSTLCLRMGHNTHRCSGVVLWTSRSYAERYRPLWFRLDSCVRMWLKVVLDCWMDCGSIAAMPLLEEGALRLGLLADIC